MDYYKKILLINPNSNKEMTISLKQLIDRFPAKMTISTYTAPGTAPRSINNEVDALASAQESIGQILHLRDQYKFDGYLVACYSLHPLVDIIKESVPPSVFVLGIFEASISTALALTPIRPPWLAANVIMKTKFGIVTTGSAWEEILGSSLLVMLGLKEVNKSPSGRFKRVETTGLNADELHEAPREEVARRMKEATKRLLRINNDATENDANANDGEETDVNTTVVKSTWASVAAAADANGKENVATNQLPAAPTPGDLSLPTRTKSPAVNDKENSTTNQLTRAQGLPTRPKTADVESKGFTRTDVKVICLGCAGMSGFDDVVREALVEELGPKQAQEIYILDPVQVGIGMLEHMIKSLPSPRL